MKKIIVISDTHGKIENLKKIEGIIKESDFVFFLGDCISDITKFKKEAGITDAPKFVLVKGNCDLFSRCVDEEIIEIEGVRMLLTHGHNYGVKGYPEGLFQPARMHNCSMVFYGHTHIAELIEDYGIRLVNPGSISAPRGGGRASYAYVLASLGKATVTIVDI